LIDDLLKLDLLWFKDMIIGSDSSLKDLLNTGALIMISLGFKSVTSAMSKMSVILVRHEKTMEEHADTNIDNSKAVERLTDELKEMKFRDRMRKENEDNKKFL